MKISIFGAGYVGLITAACFAELGNEVLCSDVSAEKIDLLKKGESPIYEPGIEDLVRRNIHEGRLSFTTDTVKAVDFGSVLFIAVGTPSMDDGKVDLRYVYSVAETIGKNLGEDDKIVVNKSTSPVGTAEEVKKIIEEQLAVRGKKYRFHVASNPEFLREGSAIDDFMRPDRIAVGAADVFTADKLRELYEPLVKNGHPIFLTDIASAEMSKYASNAFLAAKISFINEVAAICDKAGADVEEVRKIMSADKRIGAHFLYPGVGYGGSCFPKDVVGLVSIAEKHGHDAHFSKTIHKVNQHQRARFAGKIKDELSPLSGKTVAVWGLSFKPHTNDMREAPAVTIIEHLLSEGASVRAYDPVAAKEAKKIFGDKIFYADDMYHALDGADALAVITEWPQFKTPDFSKIKTLLRQPVILDGRNIYAPDRMKQLGFTYVSVGRKRIG